MVLEFAYLHATINYFGEGKNLDPYNITAIVIALDNLAIFHSDIAELFRRRSCGARKGLLPILQQRIRTVTVELFLPLLV